MLDPDVATDDRVRPARQVSGRHDPRRSEQPSVTVHPVADGEPGPGQPGDRRRHPDPEDDDIGGERTAVREGHAADTTCRRRTAALAGSGRDRPDGGSYVEAHPVLLVEPREDLADAGAEDRLERRLEHLDHVDLAAELVTGARHLRPDEPGADDHHSGARTGPDHAAP